MKPGTIESQRVYTGRVINLDVDTVRFPDGSVGSLEMIRHQGASAVIPVLGDLSEPDPLLLLVRQYRYAADSYLYEIPAGRLEKGESPDQCAARELKEEVGCTAGRIRPLLTMYTTPGFTDEQIHLFVATELSRGDTAHEREEFITPEQMTLSDALGRIRTGQIIDGKTALAILFLQTFR